MRADAHVHPVAEAEVAVDHAVRVELLRIGELLLVAVRADQQQHHALTGAHLDARDLGVDHEGAPHELQRQLVTQHLLERVRDSAGVGRERGTLVRLPPELVGTAGDGLRQCLRAADEERRQLHRDLAVVERTVRAGVGAQVVDQVGRTIAPGGAPLGHQVDEVRVQLGVRASAPRR